jgi:hypothetical protein
LDYAEFEARLVLTLDRDFWQIAVQAARLSNNPASSCFGHIRRLWNTSLRCRTPSPRRKVRFCVKKLNI